MPQPHKNLPGGWTLDTLENVCSVFTDGDWIESKDQADSGFRIIQTGNIGVGEYRDRDDRARYINLDKFQELRCTEVFEGDLLISRLPDPAGRSALLPKLKDRSVTAVDCTIVRPKTELVSSKFLLYFTNSDRYFGYIVDNLSGSTRKRISRGNLAKIQMKIPPLSEQNEIVRVLEVWDRVIQKLTQKIENKKGIKKGLMLELLTGKTRLPGFADRWETFEIDELLDYEQPGEYIVTNATYSEENKMPVLTANKGFILGYTNEINGAYRNVPVIIFDDFTMDNKFVDFAFKVKSSAIKILSAKNDGVNIKFIFERMQLIKVVIGEHRRHYLSEYRYLTVELPDIEEQNAIAKVLVTADAEIQTLEHKLKFIKDQRKYLLNNLITGKIRHPKSITVKQ